MNNVNNENNGVIPRGMPRAKLKKEDWEKDSSSGSDESEDESDEDYSDDSSDDELEELELDIRDPNDESFIKELMTGGDGGK